VDCPITNVIEIYKEIVHHRFIVWPSDKLGPHLIFLHLKSIWNIGVTSSSKATNIPFLTTFLLLLLLWIKKRLWTLFLFTFMDYREDHYIYIKSWETKMIVLFLYAFMKWSVCSLHVHEYDDYVVPLYRY
jgi:hypothetical protein